MFKKLLFLSLTILLIVGAAGCRKTKLTGANAVYEGYWVSNYTELQLKANGRADYAYDDGTVTKNITNGRLLIQGSTMKIKLLLKVTYHIDVAPHTVTDSYGNQITTMTLSGEVFIKQ